jgi:hypothetical protein
MASASPKDEIQFMEQLPVPSAQVETHTCIIPEKRAIEPFVIARGGGANAALPSRSSVGRALAFRKLA